MLSHKSATLFLQRLIKIKQVEEDLMYSNFMFGCRHEELRFRLLKEFQCHVRIRNDYFFMIISAL